MSRRSRPNKRSPEREQTIITALQWGASLRTAASLAGISFRTLHTWRENDPDFDLSISNARVVLNAKIKAALQECPDLKQMIITALKRGFTLDAASKLAGISVFTIEQWQRDDSEFNTAVFEATSILHANQAAALGESDEPLAEG